MKYKYLILILSVLLLGTSSSCKKDKDDPTEFTGDRIPFDERTMTDRQYLENAAIEFLDYFKAPDQSEASRAINHFAKLCEQYEFPDNFHDEEYQAMSRDGYEIAQAIGSVDIATLSRAVNTYVYNMARFKGLYQADDYSQKWQYIEKRDDLAMRYVLSGNVYNLIIHGEDGYWTETFTDGDTTYSVDVPRTLKIILYQGQESADKKLFYGLFTLDGKDNSHLNVKSEITFANLILSSTTKATNSQITEEYTFSIDNVSTHHRYEQLVTSTTVTGTNLCSIQAWINAQKSGNGIADMVTSVSTVNKFVDMVQVKVTLTDIKAFFNTFGDESTGMTDTKSAAEQAVRTLTSATKGEVFYTGNKTKVRATLSWEAYLYDQYSDPQQWGVRPLITFTSDNTPYDFESYFGHGRFIAVESRLNPLLKQYSQYWK